MCWVGARKMSSIRRNKYGPWNAETDAIGFGRGAREQYKNYFSNLNIQFNRNVWRGSSSVAQLTDHRWSNWEKFRLTERRTANRGVSKESISGPLLFMISEVVLNGWQLECLLMISLCTKCGNCPTNKRESFEHLFCNLPKQTENKPSKD